MNLEENHIYCGDALKLLDFIPDHSIPLILTDIPYGVVNRESAGIRKFDKEDADECNFELADLTRALVRISQGSIYVFCSSEQVSQLRENFVTAGLTTRLCIWQKTNPSPVNCEHLWMSDIETCVFARHSGATFTKPYQSSVWRFPIGKSKEHPTEKPLSLFSMLVYQSSKPGDLVLDPFLGSGTTALAAKRQGRRYLGFELNPKYVELAESKLVQNTIFG